MLRRKLVASFRLHVTRKPVTVSGHTAASAVYLQPQSSRSVIMAASSPIKLNLNNLHNLPKDVHVPKYNRNPEGSPTIVHISVGGFHRAHQALYLDKLLESGQSEGWKLVGVGLLPFDIPARDAMRAQDCLYTLVERDASGDKARVIAAISKYLYAPEQSEAVISTMADPSCRIVTLTITEGGYFIHQGTGQFNKDDVHIQHDLLHPETPHSSFGYILAALRRRQKKGLRPFTILSCDNIQHNGDVARRMITAFANTADEGLGSWLEKEGAFPNCMVDRITPATTDVHRKLVREEFGIDDLWPVTSEAFIQWVIEDDFPLGRPPWEKVGAQMTPDVLPYEVLKLRVVNCGHQALCYIGMLLGYRYSPEAMANPDIHTLLKRLFDEEVTPVLMPVPDVDVSKYKSVVLERFANPAVNDQLLRIGTEGSARIPKFVLPCIRDAIDRHSPVTFLCFTVASWIYYLGQEKDETGQPLGFNDPMVDRLRKAASSGQANPRGVLGIGEIFGDDLTGNEKFVGSVESALQDYYTIGPKETLRKWVQK